MNPGDVRGCFIIIAEIESDGLARHERWLVRCAICLRESTRSQEYLWSGRLAMHGCARCAAAYKRDRFKRA